MLEKVEEGKEYFFSSGAHVTIVRKSGKRIEYLELQRNDPQKIGYHKLTKRVLKKRFATIKYISVLGQKVPQEECIIDTKKISNSPKFRELLGYINTKQ